MLLLCPETGDKMGIQIRLEGLDEATEGVNYPPIHPICRCVTITADAELKERLAKDPETGYNYKVNGKMDFSQWKESLSDEQKAVMNKYVDNSNKRGIIKKKDRVGASARNTGKLLKYDSTKDFSIKIDGYPAVVNEGLSKATAKVAKLGGKT